VGGWSGVGGWLQREVSRTESLAAGTIIQIKCWRLPRKIPPKD